MIPPFDGCLLAYSETLKEENQVIKIKVSLLVYVPILEWYLKEILRI